MSLTGLRWRTAITAGVFFCVVMAIVLFVLLQALRSSLIEEIDTALDNRASELTFQRQDLLDLEEAIGADEDELLTSVGWATDGSTFTAWLEGDGYALLADDDAFYDDRTLGRRLLDRFPESGPERVFETMSLPELTGTTGTESMRVLGSFARDEPDGDVGLLLVVGSSLDSVDRTARLVTTRGLLAIPVLGLLVAGLVWLVADRALRPVEAIRSEVEEISAGDLERRVPEARTGDEIGRLAVTMNEMLARLETSQTTQRRFISDASHELRSPLASMAAQIDVELAHPTSQGEAGALQSPTADAELLRSLRRETSRLQRLVDDLLLLARADADPDRSVTPDATARSRWGLVDLDDVVLTEVRASLARHGDRRVAIDTSAVSGAVVRGDEDKLRRLAMNLVSNAGRHANSTVRVSLSETPGEPVGTVRLAVEDDGAGVAEADRDRVFERFVRLDEGRARDHGGSGLGLAISAEIAREHDGAVTLGDSPLGGAAFVVDFPGT